MLANGEEPSYVILDQLSPPYRELIEALNAQLGHPARAWLVGVGNGLFEDDYVAALPAPHPVCRFRRGKLVAYVWRDSDQWRVRPWGRTRGRVRNEILVVSDLLAALDLLVQTRPPWWKFWA